MAFLTKRKILNEITVLTYRVKELEEKLCPCESHEWRKIDFWFEGGTGMGDEQVIYQYKCRVCGKVCCSWKHLERIEWED